MLWLEGQVSPLVPTNLIFKAVLFVQTLERHKGPVPGCHPHPAPQAMLCSRVPLTPPGLLRVNCVHAGRVLEAHGGTRPPLLSHSWEDPFESSLVGDIL